MPWSLLLLLLLKVLLQQLHLFLQYSAGCFQVNNNIHSAVSTQWNHVSAAILNGGAIRASVDEQSRNGEEEDGEAWNEEKVKKEGGGRRIRRRRRRRRGGGKVREKGG